MSYSLKVVGWELERSCYYSRILSISSFTCDLPSTFKFSDRYLGMVAYIMDPDNFIIERQSTQCRQLQTRLDNHRENSGSSGNCQEPLRRTRMRPHYRVNTAGEVGRIFHQQGRKRIHPVRRHTRILHSAKFVNKQYAELVIPQHHRGQGVIEDLDGWRYQVMLKDEVGNLTRCQNTGEEQTIDTTVNRNS